MTALKTTMISSITVVETTARPSSMLFNAWRSQMFALSDSEEIMSLSLAVWPQSTNVTDDRRRQTGLWQYRLIGLPAMSQQKFGSQLLLLVATVTRVWT